MYTWALLTPFVFWLAGRFSFDRSTAVKRIALLLAIGVVVAFSVDRLNSSLIAAFHVRPRYGSLAQPGGPGTGRILQHSARPMIVNHFILYIGVLSRGSRVTTLSATAHASVRPPTPK